MLNSLNLELKSDHAEERLSSKDGYRAISLPYCVDLIKRSHRNQFD